MRLKDPPVGAQCPERSSRPVAGNLKSPESHKMVLTPVSEQVDVEFFRAWVMPSASTPSVQELRDRIALYEPDDLPKMIAIAREAEIACMSELGDLNRQIRDERQEAGGRRVERDISILIWTEAVGRLDSRIRWLQDLCCYLEEEQQQFQDAGARTR